jgi:diaminopimelate epimerase
MPTVSFVKMVASGNDFIIVGQPAGRPVSRLRKLARDVCERKYGVGADGLLLIEKSPVADTRMRIFNADGSEAEMCGNGARCVALFLRAQRRAQSAKLKIETKAGIIQAEVKEDNVKIKLTDPKDLKLSLPIKVSGRTIKVNFLNTGVPHAVIFVEGLDKFDVLSLGRQIRYHNSFKPAGTNVDFVEVLSDDLIEVRTYERGVEDETLACGTGAVASALVADYRLSLETPRRRVVADKFGMKVKTRSGEILKVYFDRIEKCFKDVWLQGRAQVVFSGRIIC